MTVLQVQSLPVLANQHRQISFLTFSSDLLDEMEGGRCNFSIYFVVKAGDIGRLVTCVVVQLRAVFAMIMQGLWPKCGSSP
jgi:hypothetical protein